MGTRTATAGGIAKTGPAGSRNRSTAIATKGVGTCNDLVSLMSAIIADVLTGELEPLAASTAVRAASQMLRAAELQQRYGQAGVKGVRVFRLNSKRLDG